MQLIPIANTSIEDPTPTATFDPCFTKEECDTILSDFLIEKPLTAKVGGDLVQKNRNTLIHPVPYDDKSKWLYMKLADRVSRWNRVGYNFSISGIYGDIQLLEYDEGMHYDWHVDIGAGPAAFRKLSVIVQLSNPEDYEGGEVVFKASEKERVLPKNRGQLAIFPSYVLHKVNPITKGKRYALVTWVMSHKRFM